MFSQVVFILAMLALVLTNAVGVCMVALQLPGTWLILLATGLCAWWYQGSIGIWPLTSLGVLAIVAEVVEFAAGAVGATGAGATKRAAVMATGGAVIGAIAGTFVVPIPVVGTLIGAAAGAGLAAVSGDLWAGRKWSSALKGGGGAAGGRFAGAVAKLVIAALMWLIVAVVIVWP